MNLYLFNQINQFAQINTRLDFFGVFFARYLGYIFLFILLFLFFYNFKKYRRIFFGAIISGFLARLVFVELIRKVFSHPRPFVENEVNLLFEYAPTDSFPSGHTSFFFALSFFIFFWLRKNKKTFKHWKLISFLAFLAALLIGVSRIFCGIHWPGDILGGIVVGFISGWLVSRKI